MILHDITKGIFASQVYPGDPKPEAMVVRNIKKGDDYNLSKVSFCPHTGTHIDAPLHFLQNGKSIERIKLRNFYGKCSVIEATGEITGGDMDELLPYCHSRVLIKGKGKAFLTMTAVEVLLDYNIKLIGTDAMTIGWEDENDDVHIELLKNDIPILECLNLDRVPVGDYEICAFPIKIEGLEAAPCRAVLFEQEKGI